MTDFDPTVTDSQRVDRFAAALEKVAETTDRHSATVDASRDAFSRDTDRTTRSNRRIFIAVLVFAVVSTGAAGIQQWRQSEAIESLRDLSSDVQEARDEARGAREDARRAASEAVEAREEISSRQLRIEAPAASSSAKPGAAILRVPRPPTSTGVPQPAASVPITIGATTGAGP